MIYYQNHGYHRCRNMFRLRGSTFLSALVVAIPGAGLAFAFKLCMEKGTWSLDKWDGLDNVLKNNVLWNGFISMVGFLIVFRTSQSYARFWEACTATTRMRAKWFDACAAFCAFAKHGRREGLVDNKAGCQIENLVVRLFSMLHAAALAEIEDSNTEMVEKIRAFNYDLIDAQGVSEGTLEDLRDSDARVETIYYWIQKVAVEGVSSGIITVPPPIFSRFFQEIAGGMEAFHDCVKISSIPFPFPYAQTCDCLLYIHWLLGPVIASVWTANPVWAAIFQFIQVFVLWSLNFIAVEIENPFGCDDNDLDAESKQKEMNRFLQMLITPKVQESPVLIETAACFVPQEHFAAIMKSRQASFQECWEHLNMNLNAVRSIRSPLNRMQRVRRQLSRWKSRAKSGLAIVIENSIGRSSTDGTRSTRTTFGFRQTATNRGTQAPGGVVKSSIYVDGYGPTYGHSDTHSDIPQEAGEKSTPAVVSSQMTTENYAQVAAHKRAREAMQANLPVAEVLAKTVYKSPSREYFFQNSRREEEEGVSSGNVQKARSRNNSRGYGSEKERRRQRLSLASTDGISYSATDNFSMHAGPTMTIEDIGSQCDPADICSDRSSECDSTSALSPRLDLKESFNEMNGSQTTSILRPVSPALRNSALRGSGRSSKPKGRVSISSSS